MHAAIPWVLDSWDPADDLYGHGAVRPPPGQLPVARPSLPGEAVWRQQDGRGPGADVSPGLRARRLAAALHCPDQVSPRQTRASDGACGFSGAGPTPPPTRSLPSRRHCPCCPAAASSARTGRRATLAPRAAARAVCVGTCGPGPGRRPCGFYRGGAPPRWCRGLRLRLLGTGSALGCPAVLETRASRARPGPGRGISGGLWTGTIPAV